MDALVRGTQKLGEKSGRARPVKVGRVNHKNSTPSRRSDKTHSTGPAQGCDLTLQEKRNSSSSAYIQKHLVRTSSVLPERYRPVLLRQVWWFETELVLKPGHRLLIAGAKAADVPGQERGDGEDGEWSSARHFAGRTDGRRRRRRR